jgi:uncharacterized tellurite resistance protein B-like protein
MCTTCDVTLGGRVARALWSMADDLAEVARTWGPTRGGSRTGRERSVLPGAHRSTLDPRIAAAALMLEVANADEHFSPTEQTIVACTLREEFGLGPVQADRIVRAARRMRAEAPGVWTFTSVLVEAFTTKQREVLAGILEQLADADGESTWQEHYAVRSICSLLRVDVAHV